MDAQPSPSFPHNTLWRKLRRRYFVDRFSMLAALFVLPSAVCSVCWLSHGPLWLTLGCGVLWLLISAFMTLMMAMSFRAEVHRGTYPSRPLPQRLSMLWSVFVNGGTILSLLLGHVDWAFYLSYGLSGLNGWWSNGRSSRQTTLHLLFALALCLAFAAHAVWIVVALLLLQLLQPWPFRPSLPEVIRLRPTRAEYVARSREACAAGGG